MKNVELLAPGGSYENIIAALNSGADAVYTSLDKFGARAYANNLSIDEMKEVIDYAHINGKKIYLTVNTLLKNNELENELYSHIKPLYQHGLDAVIVQDFGVLKFIKDNFPLLHIHASTQMTIMGKYTAKFLKDNNVTRLVTPRELSLDEIKDIKDNVDIEIESFVHGALCYCYSGQCLMSSLIGGRSGNRGRCAQPCRLEYDALFNNKLINKNDERYQLSPKDICTLSILPKIIESGVYSLKIEGRMKNKYYVAGVTSIYRKYIDLYLKNPKNYKVDPKDIEYLMDLFNRNGFSNSYYETHNSKEMMSLKKVGFRKENEKLKADIDKMLELMPKKEIDFDLFITKGEPLRISGIIDDEYVECLGDVVEEAKNASATEKSIKKNILKFGNTNYSPGNVNIYLDKNVFVPNSALNKLRREFVNSINDTLLRKYRRVAKNEIKYNYENSKPLLKKNINVLVYDINQLKVCLEKDFIDGIYIEQAFFKPDQIKEVISNNNGKKIYIAMPFIFRKDDLELFDKSMGNIISLSDGFLIRNIEEYLYLKEKNISNFIFDYNVYAYNKLAKEVLSDGLLTSPMELNLKAIRDNGGVDEFIVYGNYPLMITANCIRKNNLSCNKNNDKLRLIDRKNKKMPVMCVCRYCYNLIFNSDVYSAFSKAKEIGAITNKSVRIQFTLEDKNQVEDILDKVYNTFVKGEIEDDSKTSTRGHLNRGVQ